MAWHTTGATTRRGFLRWAATATASATLAACGAAAGPPAAATAPAPGAAAGTAPTATIPKAGEAATPRPTAASNAAAKASGATTIRLAFFPNVTHAPALVGVGKGSFGDALGSGATLDTKTFNAGPALVEAMFAGDVDLGYVGPNPAINGYVKSKGKALKIIAGAASGGASFVVRSGAGIASPKDLDGKKLATPQLGGTQDVALRFYLQQHGLRTADKGGTVQVTPMQNPDIVSLMKQGKLDGAWVPEPWASLIVDQAGGQVFVDERTLWPDGKFTTTDVIASAKFLEEHAPLLESFLRAHVEAIQLLQANADQAKQVVNDQIQRITTQAMPAAVLDKSFANLDFTFDPLAKTLATTAENAFALGFLGETKPDLSGIYDLDPLNGVLAAKGLPAVAKA